MTVLDKLRSLIKVHCVTIKDSVSELEASLSGLYGQADRQSEFIIEEARGLTHQLKGSSGSIGFRDVSNAAAILDDYLKSISGMDRKLNDSELQRIFHMLGKLKRVTATISPEHSSLYHAQFDQPPRGPDATIPETEEIAYGQLSK